MKFKTRKAIEKNQYNQNVVLWKKINKIDKSLARMFDIARKEKTQITNVRDERGIITPDFLDIKIIRNIINNFMPINLMS